MVTILPALRQVREDLAGLRVHVRLCGQFPAIPADGPSAGPVVVKPDDSIVLTEVGGPDLKDGLRAALGPEHLCALDAEIELLDQ